MSPSSRGYPLAMRATTTDDGERIGARRRRGGRILYGAAYPATAVALRSFTPLGIAGLACTLAAVRRVVLARAGVLQRPSVCCAERAEPRPAGRPRGARRPRVHRGHQHRGRPQRPDRDGLRRAALCRRRRPPRRPDPRRAHPTGHGRRVRAWPCSGPSSWPASSPSADTLTGVAWPGARPSCSGCTSCSPAGGVDRYALDGTLVTIANLIGRGPVLLAVELVRSPGHAHPRDPGPGGGHRAALDRVRVELDRQPAPDRQRSPGAGRDGLCRAPADAALVGAHRGRPSRGTSGTHAAPRCRPDPRRDRRRERRLHRAVSRRAVGPWSRRAGRCATEADEFPPPVGQA